MWQSVYQRYGDSGFGGFFVYFVVFQGGGSFFVCYLVVRVWGGLVVCFVVLCFLIILFVYTIS